LRIHRHARGGQRLEIAPSGGHRHLKLIGQLRCGHPATALKFTYPKKGKNYNNSHGALPPM